MSLDETSLHEMLSNNVYSVIDDTLLDKTFLDKMLLDKMSLDKTLLDEQTPYRYVVL
jgi:hypothetical protein